MGLYYIPRDDYLMHHGIKGQKWGIRRYQNPDGSLTPEGIRKYENKGIKKGYLRKREDGKYELTEKGARKLPQQGAWISGKATKKAGDEITLEEYRNSQKTRDLVKGAVIGGAAVLTTAAAVSLGTSYVAGKKLAKSIDQKKNDQ